MDHPNKISLFKYAIDPAPVIKVNRSNKADLEEHVNVKEHVVTCTECAEYVSFVSKLAQTITRLRKEELAPSSPCPDSWDLAACIAGEIEGDSARRINAHIGFCDQCLEIYLSLADEKELDRMFSTDQESEAKSDLSAI